MLSCLQLLGLKAQGELLGSKINNEQRKNNELQLHAAVDMAQDLW